LWQDILSDTEIILDKLEAMRVFVAVAEAGGFAPAARRLGLSAPAATRAVAALEEAIGVRLLHRTTRVVRTSSAGQRFLSDAKRILAEVEDAEASAAGTHTELRGPLLVTASVLFGRLHVAPILLEFLGKHRDVRGQLLLVDHVVDLVAEGFDVAVRIAELPDSSLAAVRVGSVRRVVCASPGYLRRRRLRDPVDLQHHACLGIHETLGEPNWSFGGNFSRVPPPRYRLVVNNAQVAIDAALAGQGVTRVLSYMVAEHVRNGSLAIVLEEFEPPPKPVHVVYTEGRRSAARVRAFVSLAAKRLRALFDSELAPGSPAPARRPPSPSNSL
jgi:DNA-binding transcriptional LysR family regulator